MIGWFIQPYFVVFPQCHPFHDCLSKPHLGVFNEAGCFGWKVQIGLAVPHRICRKRSLYRDKSERKRLFLSCRVSAGVGTPRKTSDFLAYWMARFFKATFLEVWTASLAATMYQATDKQKEVPRCVSLFVNPCSAFFRRLQPTFPETSVPSQKAGPHGPDGGPPGDGRKTLKLL